MAAEASGNEVVMDKKMTHEPKRRGKKAQSSTTNADSTTSPP
jgi:hypothetical protein